MALVFPRFQTTVYYTYHSNSNPPLLSPTLLTHSPVMVDTSQYKVGIVLSIEDKSVGGKKPLKICSVNVGEESSPITVVTSASNVREGSR